MFTRLILLGPSSGFDCLSIKWNQGGASAIAAASLEFLADGVALQPPLSALPLVIKGALRLFYLYSLGSE